MNSPILQLLVLAGIAIFLILRLRNVLGTRDGFEPPREMSAPVARRTPDFEVIEGGPDPDITDHVDEDSNAATALAQMKSAEPSFGVNDFLGGAKGAYEMILMGFENGDMDQIKPFISEEIYDAFLNVVASREDQGLTVDAQFIGVRETTLVDATFDEASRMAEVTVRFVGELVYAVRNAEGDIVEGDEKQSKKQKDVWTFARSMGTDDPNWQLVATSE
jgi:predicted lipid-binding transport protein (Tim44 family)